MSMGGAISRFRIGRTGAAEFIALVGIGVFLASIGAFVMRGAGCAYNDYVDRDYDAKVARTANRPIPSGQVSAKAALAFAIGLSLLGFLVLICFNGFTIGLGIASQSQQVEQVYFEVDRRSKLEALTRLIDVHDFRYGIVF